MNITSLTRCESLDIYSRPICCCCCCCYYLFGCVFNKLLMYHHHHHQCRFLCIRSITSNYCNKRAIVMFKINAYWLIDWFNAWTFACKLSSTTKLENYFLEQLAQSRVVWLWTEMYYASARYLYYSVRVGLGWRCVDTASSCLVRHFNHNFTFLLWWRFDFSFIHSFIESVHKEP